MTAFGLLGVVLEGAALAALLSLVASVVALGLPRLARRTSPEARADLAFVGAFLPLAIVAITLAAALAPSLFAALGDATADHCPEHLHHPHLCVVHFAGMRPAAALLGAAVLALFALRVIDGLLRWHRTAADLRALERLGAVEASGGFPLVLVPGPARLCHAVGLRRRRVVTSRQLVDALAPEVWRAVHAHEEEHLRRRDPLAAILVEAALWFATPGLAGMLARAFRRNAEGACDRAAASAVGDGARAASALIEVARQLARGPRPASAGQLGAAELDLEARVRALLAHGAVPPQRPRAFLTTSLLVTTLAIAALSVSDELHHALETLLFHLL
ncbi:MAG: hypothetical protein IT382_15640 [Deltaproteobacteria bacterium]|nr:hypothetical protein [Deltaproteobacteria bacterium]